MRRRVRRTNKQTKWTEVNSNKENSIRKNRFSFHTALCFPAAVYLQRQHTFGKANQFSFFLRFLFHFLIFLILFYIWKKCDIWLLNKLYLLFAEKAPWRIQSPTKAAPPDHLQSLKFIYNHFHDNFVFGVINSSNFFLPSIFVFRLFFIVPFLSLLFNPPILFQGNVFFRFFIRICHFSLIPLNSGRK